MTKPWGRLTRVWADAWERVLMYWAYWPSDLDRCPVCGQLTWRTMPNRSTKMKGEAKLDAGHMRGLEYTRISLVNLLLDIGVYRSKPSYLESVESLDEISQNLNKSVEVLDVHIDKLWKDAESNSRLV